jgi:protocatechuate 3,4-dioxygenase beta subunit
VAEASGFVPIRRPVLPVLEDINLPQAQMPADAGCRVKVLGPDGRPAPGAQVRGEAKKDDFDLMNGWEPAERRAVTGSGGEARLPCAKSEPLLLHVLVPGLPPWGGAEIKGSGTGRLVRGARRTIEVRSQDARAVAGAVVRDLSSGFVLGLTDAAGRLEISLPLSGEAALQVDTTGGRRGTFRWRVAAGPTPVRILRLPPPVPLSGQVLDQESRLPLAGALVWPASDPGRAMRAGRKGAFRWRAVQEYEEINAASPGHVSSFRNRTAKPPLPISLAPSFSLSGIVMDEAGRPLASTEIRVGIRAGRIDDDTYDGEIHRRTEDTGAFQVSGLVRSAFYDVRASHPGFALSAHTIARPPAGPRLSIRLVLKRGRTVFGRIEDGAGRPVEGAQIHMTLDESADAELERNRDTPHNVVSGPDGRFELSSLPAGWFSLRVKHEGFAPLSRSGIEVPTSVETADLGDLHLTGDSPLTGKVLDPEGRPLAGAEVWALSLWDFALVSSLSITLPDPVAVTGPDGGFTIWNPEGDLVQLDICRKGFQPSEIRVREWPGRPVRAVLVPVEAPASLSGRVLDSSGAPVPGARMTVHPQRSVPCPPDTAIQGEADEEGFFSFSDLSPGPWSLSASAKGYLDSGQETPPALGAGEHRGGVEIVLQPVAAVNGYVFNSGGAPVGKVWVQAGGPADPSGSTAADGSYRLERVAPGEHLIEAYGPEGTKASHTLVVEPGENRLDLTLDPKKEKSELRGRVLGPDGVPVAGAQVVLSYSQGGDVTYTGADGSFLLLKQEEGGRIWAEREGYVSSGVDLESRGPGSIELRLERTGAVTGHLLGLSPQKPDRVLVTAYDGHQEHFGFVDAQGNYRIPYVPPGDIQVKVTAGSWKAEGQVVLKPGEPEAVLDLTLSTQEEKP